MISDENSDSEDEVDEEKETNQRVKFEYIDLYPEELEAHPVNLTLYGEEDVEKDENITTLVESIRRKGLLEPLVIKEEKTEDEGRKKYIIISGHRRWRALKYIYENELEGIIVDDKKDEEKPSEFVRRKIKCQILSFRNEVEEKKAIVEYNRRRKKRYSQFYNEIEMLHDIYDSDALKRSRSNLRNSVPDDPKTLVRKLKVALKRGDFADLNLEMKDVDWTLTPEELAFEYGHLIDGRMDDDYFSENYEIELGKTVDKIAKELGQKPSNVKKLTKVGRFAYDHGDQTARNAMKYLDQGIISLNGAEIIVKLRNRYLLREQGAIIAKRLGKEIEEGIQKKIRGEKGNRLTPAAAMKRFKELVPNYDPKPDNQKTAFTIPVYSVIYVDPFINDEFSEDLESDVIPDYLGNLSIHAAKNAALFIVAKRKNIKHCFNLMQVWGFKLQTFVTVRLETGYGVLLFSTRGKWIISEGENQISDDTVLNREDIPNHIMKMYPEVVSLFEVGAKGEQREGWGKPFEEFKPEPLEDIENDGENVIEETNTEPSKRNVSEEYSGNGDSRSKEHYENKKDNNDKKYHGRGSAGKSKYL